MCCGLNYPPTIGPAGPIHDGESSLEAAARRYHERKRRENAEAKTLSNDDSSEAVTVVSDFPKDDSSKQGIQEKTEVSKDAAKMNSRKGSFGDRWRKFKRHHLP